MVSIQSEDFPGAGFWRLLFWYLGFACCVLLSLCTGKSCEEGEMQGVSGCTSSSVIFSSRLEPSLLEIPIDDNP